MIRAVAALAVAALLLTADPAAAEAAAIGGRAVAGTGSPSSAAISAAAGKKATARRNAAAVGRGAAAVGRPAARKRTALALSYMGDAGPAASVVLRCYPTGGTHPKRAAACRVLAKIHGDPELLKPAALMCTLEYAPVTAQIKGTWKGRGVDWSRRFGNRCEMRRTTDVLLDF
jgi:hypothetical protein